MYILERIFSKEKDWWYRIKGICFGARPLRQEWDLETFEQKIKSSHFFIAQINIFLTIYLFIWERKTNIVCMWGGAEEENLQADSPLSMHHPSQPCSLDSWVTTHEIMTWSKTKSQRLNQLSHPDAPQIYSFNILNVKYN